MSNLNNHTNTKYVAGFSLAVMAAGFIASLFLPDTLATKLMLGGFEAGLVGGVADWFAVTALFRHPLGVPIPHTSLLLKNRDKIVNSLISAMETELLNKASITEQLQRLNLLSLLASEATRLVGKRSVRTGLESSLRAAIEQLPLDKLGASIQSELAKSLDGKNLKPWMDAIATAAVRDGWDEKALDMALVGGSRWAAKRETEQLLGRLAHQKVKELQVGGLMGFAVQAFAGFLSEEKLGAMLQNMLVTSIWELSQPENVHRQRILADIREGIERVTASEESRQQLASWLKGLVEGPQAEQFVLRQLEELRRRVLDRLEEDERQGGRMIVAGWRFAIDRLNGMGDLTGSWEQGLLTHLVNLVEANHYRIGELVRSNLNKLDDESLVKMLEERIGGDLQWIRVNGAVCGFLVGIVLTVVHMLIA